MTAPKTIEEIADEMLLILSSPRRWCKGDFAVRWERYCLYGARARVDDLPLSEIEAEDLYAWYYDDPYMLLLDKIIREQFPTLLPVRNAPMSTVITSFNDNEETHYPHIRMVLEKARYR